MNQPEKKLFQHTSGINSMIDISGQFRGNAHFVFNTDFSFFTASVAVVWDLRIKGLINERV